MRITALGLLLMLGTVSTAAEPKPAFVLRHEREVVTVAFSPDGKVLASASGNPGCIIFSDAATGKELRRIEGELVGDAIAFSPDGKLLASVRNWKQGKQGGVVQLWDTATGKLAQQLQGDSERSTLNRCVAYSPDGKLLAVHNQFGNLRVWETATGRELLKLPTKNAGHTLAFSPDGKLLAFDVGYTIRLCETATGKELHKLEGHQQVISARGYDSGYVQAIAFSPDGKTLASVSCDNMARVWDVATGKTFHVLEGHRGFVNAVTFTRDGKRLLTGGEDGTIRLWDSAAGKQLGTVQAHQQGVREDGDKRRDVFSLALSPDGKRLASGGRDTAVRVWDTAGLFPGSSPRR